MKTVVLLAVVVVLASCGRNDEPILPEGPENYDTLVDVVKSQAAPRINRFSMAGTQWTAFPNADPATVQKIMLRSVRNNDTIPTDTLSRYHFYDFNDMDSVFLFTIVRCDPSGFSSMYHFTLDTKAHRLSSCTLIGSSRNAKGYKTNDKLTFAKDGKSLIVNASSEIVEGNTVIEDNCSTRFDFYKDETTSKLLHNAHRERPLTADQGL